MNFIIDTEEIIAVLRQFNPWWRNEPIVELPAWHRPAFQDMMDWVNSPDIRRSLLLTGPRQVGKTTIFRQVIQHLLQNNISPENIFYATFDHPLLMLVGQERVLQVWREYIPPKKDNGTIEYIFLDELQFINHWATWLKHQTDFQKNRRSLIGKASKIGRLTSLWSMESG